MPKRSWAGLCALLVACGSSAGGEGTSAAAGGHGQGTGGAVAIDASGGGAAGGDAAAGLGYPPGPYGNQVGDVLPNIALLGYLRQETTGLASAATLQDADLAAVRAASNKQFAMIHISGFT
ncbi:MAG: hypothetical protein R3B13_31720 [Polyangiaceae bacterium]